MTLAHFKKDMNGKWIIKQFSAILVIHFFVSSVALGQQSSSDDQTRLETIVVTAQKREQNINDLGLSVTAIDAQALKSRHIETLEDLANNIPGLSYTNSSSNTPVFTLRGVGFYDTSLAAYPDVSIYVDEIPLPFPSMTGHSFDLERVEVLKGPQGTLFGDNSTGGAINFITAKPTNTFHTGFDLGVSRFATFTGDAFVSGPINDSLRARLAVNLENGGGWQHSNTRPDDYNGRPRNYAARLLLDYETGPVRLELNVNGWIDKSDTQAKQYIAYGPQFAVPNPQVSAEHFSPQTPTAADWTPGGTYGDNHLWQTALRADVDIASDLTVTSLTNYAQFHQHEADDGDGLPESASDLNPNDGNIGTFTEELRLANHGDPGLRWVVGANFEHSVVDQDAYVSSPQSSANETLGLIGYPIQGQYFISDQNMVNIAGFGNIEYDLGQVTLKSGVRYSDSDRRVADCARDPLTIQTNTGGFFFNVLLDGKYGPQAPDKCFAINNLPTAVNGVVPGAPGLYTGELRENNVSWREGIDWHPTQDLLLYGNVAKGYKAGGYPASTVSTFVQYLPVRQESVLAYETGFKQSVFEHRVQINGALFYYDYRDKQLRAKLIDPVFGSLDQLQNIPKSSVKGAELEVDVKPVRDLTLGFNFTYLDAKVTEFNGINGAGVTANFAGANVPYTPRYQAALNADYNFALAGLWRGFLGAGVNYRSGTVSVIGGELNPPLQSAETNCIYCIASYALVDLRAGVERDKWRLELWGKNVFNKYYWNNVLENFDATVRQAGMPATFGVTVSWQF